MEKYLIAIDLDGTLLNSNSEVPEKNKEVLNKLVELGHMVVLATGRPYHATIDIYNHIGLKTPLITDNGGNIREPKNPNFQIVTDGIPVQVSHDIFNYTKPHLVSAFYSFGDHVYAYQYLDRLHQIFMGSQKAKIVHTEFDKYHHEPTGMIYLVSNEFVNSFETYLKTQYKTDVSFRLWGSDSKHSIYEIYKYNSSKLSAIEWVRDHYNIKPEHTIAFGDGLNDIEMIQGVARGIAMPNGIAELKAVAKEISPLDNDQCGVGLYLEKFFNLV